MLKDKIFINEIVVKLIVGINDDERINKQEVIISLTLFMDLKNAGKHDDIAKTVSYYDIAEFVESYAGATKFKLIETLAENISNQIFSEFGVSALKVRIEKPKALKQTKKVGIEIYRENKSNKRDY